LRATIGGISELPLTLSASGIDTVFVCMSDVSENAARDVVEMCDRAGTEYRIVPTLTDLLKMNNGSGPMPGGNGHGNGNGNGYHANGKAAAPPPAPKPA